MSFWLAIASAAMFGAHLLPLVGIGYLLWFSTSNFMTTGALMQAALVALLLEALVGYVPRSLAAIPLVAYGAYYAEYARERFIDLPAAEKRLQDSNFQRLAFDSKTEDLLLDGLQASAFLIRYEVPIVYALRTASEADVTALRLTLPTKCEQNAKTLRLQTGPFIVFHESQSRRSFCVFRQTVSRLSLRGGPVVSKTHGPPAKPSEGMFPVFLNFSKGGRELGRFVQTSHALLTFLPSPMIGCGLLDHPASWVCAAEFRRTYVALDGFSGPADSRAPSERSGSDHSLSALAAILGVVPRSEEELATLEWTRQ